MEARDGEQVGPQVHGPTYMRWPSVAALTSGVQFGVFEFSIPNTAAGKYPRPLRLQSSTCAAQWAAEAAGAGPVM